MSRIAVILAGGLGTRLYPYTITIPKPLIPIGQYSILEVLIRQLRHYGFSEIVITVNYLADMIESYFRDGSRYGVRIRYARETKRLGTMGPLRGVPDLPDDFLVANGDILTDIDFEKFVSTHNCGSAVLTVGTFRRYHEMSYGVIESDESGRISGFQEKPEIRVDVSMGLYMMNNQALSFIPEDKFFGFDDLMMALIREGSEIRTYFHDGYWRDLGTPEDYQLACEEFDKKKDTLLRG